MTNTKHTPGPWICSDTRAMVFEPPTEGSIDIYSQDRIWLAAVHGTHVGEKDDSRNVANARLIAAAPELLEVLEWLVERLGCRTAECSIDKLWAIQNEVSDKARAVIAKAGGQA